MYIFIFTFFLAEILRYQSLYLDYISDFFNELHKLSYETLHRYY